MTYLEFARRQKKWSQDQLGTLVRIHQVYISMMEVGRGIPTPDEAERLSLALDVPADLLLQPVPDLAAMRKSQPTVDEAVRQ